MDSRYYPGVEADVPKLMVELRDLFDEDYEVQTMNVSTTTILQARKSSTLRDLTGLSAALTIKVTPEAGGTRVEIGMQKWFDKAAVAAVALLLSMGALLALPALGAYWQYKIGRRMEDNRRSYRTKPVAIASRSRALRYVALLIPPALLLLGLGANLRVGLACASCGAEQKDSARFCNSCGKTIDEQFVICR
jgi:hypothetical protein